jgi:thioredoxin reductase/bacterioferritin-associated ferredoxin
MTLSYDLIIIGAGPAGMAAALEATGHGLRVLVLGEQKLPGGQMYRSLEQTSKGMQKLLGSSYYNGRALLGEFRQCPAEYIPGAAVWQVEQDGSLCYLADGEARQVTAKRILIASGARERPVPIPGWTLPGVMAATASDVLLKSHSIVPFSNIVLAGNGPLLFLTADRLIQAGADLKAVLDTTPPGNLKKALPCLPKALLGAQYLLKGLAFKWRLKQNSIPVLGDISNLEAVGSDSLQAVRFSSGGAAKEIQADTLLLHNGVVPDTQITASLQCELGWDEIQRYWRPVLDDWGNTSLDRVAVAGDAAGISGGAAAALAGRIAALHAAYVLGKLTRQERNRKAVPLRRRLILERSVRPFLDRLFSPAAQLLVPQNDQTIVCRCEEISAGQIRQALKLGALGPNQLKTQTRAGMGPCQGRMCGLVISEMIAAHHGIEVKEVGYLRVRPPLKPITLDQLASVELNSDGSEPAPQA